MAETDRDASNPRADGVAAMHALDPSNTGIGNAATAEHVTLDLTAIESLNSSGFLLYLQELGVELHAKDGKLQLNAPTGVLTSDLQNELRRRKPDLLAYLATLPEDNTERVAPLTFAQQRLWLLDRFAPNSITYNIPQSWIIEDDLDLQVLHIALEKLIERHPALRTAIEVHNGEPVQVIKKRVDIPFTITDLQGDDNALASEENAGRLLIEEGRKPFALNHAPLIRFHAIRISTNKCIFSYCVHHIVADQWSLEVLKRELKALYIETISGQPAMLPMLTTTYADFAIRDKSVATRGLHQQQLEYWLDRLFGVSPLLELPFAATRGSQQSDAGATLEIAIDEATTRRLRDLASRNHTSLYLLMLAVFETLLYRYTGQTDMCIGTPITGRKTRADEALIGMFVNMLPLRATLNPSDPFEQLLKQVGRAVLMDFENSDIPFQKIVTDVHPHRSSSHAPLFQFLFALNPLAPVTVDSQQETYIGISKYDLSLQISERAETLDVFIEYRTELYTAQDIEQFGRHFLQLAASVSTSPHAEIRSLTLMTAEDLESATRWNQTELAYDKSATLVSLLDKQFDMNLQVGSDAVALYSQQESLTYAQLRGRATSLACSLQQKGCGPGTYIAVCLERTPELIVSILAILYAGAAYLPLDAKYPEDRLSYMLKDSGAKLLITSRNELSSRLATNCSQLQLLYIEEFPDGSDSQLNVLPAKPESSDAAYLIYTSGSTGQPKGVIVEHGNAVALIAWAQAYFAPELLRGMLASTSICFDLSVFEIFVPLATGNSIILVNDVLELPRSPHAGRVTIVNTVPSAMSALLQAGLPSNVQAVCLAGEFLPTELVDRIYAAGVPQVFDLYGPTETTTYSTCTLRRRGAMATIGRPIANTRIYLLDENLSEPPAGAIGEIFIGGAGVTRGYLDRPELTADRYLNLPAIDNQGRLYRTGDLARRQRDGQIIYLGRRDQQVKLRGHRIELGEIESALREITHASELAVIVQKRETGDALIAFVVERTSSTNPSSWLAALRLKLPAFMLPSQIILLDSMPHTPNGKVDRNALSQSRQRTTEASKLILPPRNLLEQWIANIWAHRLGRSYVARNQHFFEDLGGHSLVAFEIFAEIERRIGVEMMLATLFQAPSVELLTSVVQRLPHRVPANLEFVQEGLSEVVLYQLPASASLHHASQEPDSVGNRIMRLHAAKEASAIESWTRHIVAFECTRPALSLLASGEEKQLAQQLATSLAKAGFQRVEIDVAMHGGEAT